MKINTSVAGSLAASGLQGAQGNKTSVKSDADQITSTKKPTLQSANLQSNSATLESGAVSDFLKQQNTPVLESAVQEAASKPTIGKVEISQLKDVESQDTKGSATEDAISELKKSVNQDILIAMANSGSILS